MEPRDFESGASATPPTAPVAPSNGYPTDGNPVTPLLATKPGAYWFYALAEELRALIVASGQTPSSSNLSQILTALRSAGVFATAALFDNSTVAATTAFVQRALGNYSNYVSLSTATVLSVSAVGQLIQLSGGVYTTGLPSGSAVESGSKIEFLNASGVSDKVLSPSGSDVFYMPTGASVATLTLLPGDSVELVSIGSSAWFVVGGSVALNYAQGAFGALSAANGCQNPNGLIMQVGSWISSGVSGGQVPVTFPIAFAHGCTGLVLGCDNNNTTTSSVWFDSKTSSGFNGRANLTTMGCYYIAMGW